MNMLLMLMMLAPQLLSGLTGGLGGGAGGLGSMLPLMLLGGGRGGGSKMLMSMMLMQTMGPMGLLLGQSMGGGRSYRRRRFDRRAYSAGYNKGMAQALMMHR